ncbi:MAG: hypothetical protein Q9176_001281 [Flavoplaca citrina]
MTDEKTFADFQAPNESLISVDNRAPFSMTVNPMATSSESISAAPSDQPLRPEGLTPARNAWILEEIKPPATEEVADALTERMDRLRPASSDPGIMRLAVETRLEIFRHFIIPNRDRLCPHTRLPLLVSSPRIDLPFVHRGQPVHCPSGPNRTCGLEYGQEAPHEKCLQEYLRSNICFDAVNKLDFSLLRVCQQFYAEAMDMFYSENIFYCEQRLTLAPNQNHNRTSAVLKVPEHLVAIPPQRRHLVKRIGFSVTDESLIDYRFLIWQHLCAWINRNFPNLQHTYILLFNNPTASAAPVCSKEKKPPIRPSDRFLMKMIDFLDTLPGRKTIEYRGSNKNKRSVGNILAPYFKKGRKNRTEKDQTIRVIGGCYCQCWVHKDSAKNNCHMHNWTGPDTLWPWLRDWNDEKAKHASRGSCIPKLCPTHKGLLTGCLMCWKLKECVHDRLDRQLRPGRIELDEGY